MMHSGPWVAPGWISLKRWMSWNVLESVFTRYRRFKIAETRSLGWLKVSVERSLKMSWAIMKELSVLSTHSPDALRSDWVHPSMYDEPPGEIMCHHPRCWNSAALCHGNSADSDSVHSQLKSSGLRWVQPVWTVHGHGVFHLFSPLRSRHFRPQCQSFVSAWARHGERTSGATERKTSHCAALKPNQPAGGVVPVGAAPSDQLSEQQQH